MPLQFLGREAAVKGLKNAVLKWLGVNWVWVVMVSVLVGLGLKLFSTYAEQLPYVSSDHTAWASFGSLLAGFFTFTGTVATVATLLFLARQNKAMQKVTQAQLDTLTFERYINHRRLFLDQLNELVCANKNTFRFRDPIKLYNSLFPMNSPHNCIFKVEPLHGSSGAPDNHIAEIYELLDKIKATLGTKIFTEKQTSVFLMDLYALIHGLLIFEPLADVRDGDVQWGVKMFGINIYSLDLCIKPALKIANTVLRFTGNKEVFDGEFNYTSIELRRALIRDYVRKNPSNYTAGVLRTIRGVPDLAFLESEIREFKIGSQYISNEIVHLLWRTFSSADSLNSLAIDSKFDGLIQECLLYFRDIKVTIKKGDANYDRSMSIHATLMSLMFRSGSRS